MGKYSRYLSICFLPNAMNQWECAVHVSKSVCVCVIWYCVCVPWRPNKKAAVSETTKAEKKPSALNNQSSLLAIYDIFHYITVPLACRHLHIPVTSLQGLLIINGSHMLPGGPYYRIITATQKAKKNGNYVDTEWNTKPIKASDIIDDVSLSTLGILLLVNIYRLGPSLLYCICFSCICEQFGKYFLFSIFCTCKPQCSGSTSAL